MKKVPGIDLYNEQSEENSLLWAWKNQHPLMHIWFVFSSVSLFSVYAILLTQF
jgi:hypothetical protein